MDTRIDRFNSRRSTVYGTGGMVATSQPLAAQAGLSILEAGGNAFDAAVATAAVLNVVEPTSTGIGGDVFACFRTAAGELGGLNSSGPAPASATTDRVSDIVGGDDPTMPTHGPLTVTVPGAARGWEWTVEQHGRLTLAEVLQPAIRYAKEGYPVSEVIATYWRFAEELFETEHAKAAYLIDGRAPRTGELMRLPRLGETFEAVAAEGADVVYEGAIAEAIAAEVQAEGGLLTVDDLARFEPTPVEPESVSYHGVDVFELPPNTQGRIALETLAIAAEAGIDPDTFGSVEYTHTLIEAMKLAFHDGHHHLTDPDHVEVTELLDPAHITDRVGRIDPEGALEVDMLDSLAAEADTVLLCVGDTEGNLVSYINSRFMGFGSGLVAGETGIALQNRGASFSLDPHHPNHIAPNKRPFHTLIPAMARFDSDDWMAFGVMGGYMQPQGHVQVITNLVDGGMSLQEALDVARWRHQEDGGLAIEARFDTDLIHGLLSRGHDLRVRTPIGFGGAQAVRCEDGILSGATEPRKDGTVAAQ